MNEIVRAKDVYLFVNGDDIRMRVFWNFAPGEQRSQDYDITPEVAAVLAAQLQSAVVQATVGARIR